MRKIYSASIAVLLLISGISFSQTITYTPIDTIKYGPIGGEIICSARLINTSANAVSMRVTREKNVMGDAPNWTSAFCMKVCYLQTTDSVNFTFNPMDTVNFTFHFYTLNETLADSATAIMKWKNISTPSNTFYQKFYGITQTNFGVHAVSDEPANVSVFPMPVLSGSDFSMNISNVNTGKPVSVVIYNIFGSVVSKTNVIEGINFMNLDLPAGVYSYSLISENMKINSGKIAVAK